MVVAYEAYGKLTALQNEACFENCANANSNMYVDAVE